MDLVSFLISKLKRLPSQLSKNIIRRHRHKTLSTGSINIKNLKHLLYLKGRREETIDGDGLIQRCKSG